MAVDYILRTFGVDNALSVTIDHLSDLIQRKIEESLNLEFKGSDAWNQPGQRIGKSISAFANSDGGLLIVGISEGSSRGKNQKIAGKLEPINDTKEQFQQKLWNLVKPWPSGTIIVPVKCDGGNVFLNEIPGNQSPPIQDVQSKAYYMRTNSINMPMEAYQVEMAFNRRTKPSIIPEVRVTFNEQGIRKKNEVILIISLLNTSVTTATYPAVTFVLPPGQGNNISIRKVEGLFKDGLKEFNIKEWKTSSFAYMARGKSPLYGMDSYPFGAIAVSSELQDFSFGLLVACMELPLSYYKVDFHLKSLARVSQIPNLEPPTIFKLDVIPIDDESEIFH
jgi:hypothetical protein